MNRDNMFARGMLAFVAAGHLITGLLLFFSGEGGLGVVKRLYGAEFEADPQFVYVARPLGVFMLALGLLQLRAMMDPWRWRTVLDVTIAVFVLRQLQRVIWAPAVFEAFGLTRGRHWIGTGFFFVILMLLVVARVRLKPPSAADAVMS